MYAAWWGGVYWSVRAAGCWLSSGGRVFAAVPVAFPGGRISPRCTSIQARTLASCLNASRKDGQDARAFREVSPGFGAGESLVAAKSAAVWFGCAVRWVVADFKGSSSVHRSPSPRVGWMLAWLPQCSLHSCSRPTRRQDAANEHQHSGTNLGFVSECPKERRAGCPCFPYS